MTPTVVAVCEGMGPSTSFVIPARGTIWQRDGPRTTSACIEIGHLSGKARARKPARPSVRYRCVLDRYTGALRLHYLGSLAVESEPASPGIQLRRAHAATSTSAQITLSPASGRPMSVTRSLHHSRCMTTGRLAAALRRVLPRAQLKSHFLLRR